MAFAGVAPLVAIVIFQWFGITVATSVATSVQVSDAAGWANCASTLAAGTLPAQAEWEWCLRRPEGFVLAAPMYVVTHGTLTSVLALQAGLAGVALLLLSLSLWRTVRFPPLACGLAVVLVTPTATLYATSTGPESIALSLACLALALLLWAFQRKSLPLALSAVVLSTLAYQARPGNPLLLVAVPISVIAFLWPSWTSMKSKVFASISTLAVALVAFSGIAFALRLLGYSSAGHGGNVWATILGSPDIPVGGCRG